MRMRTLVTAAVVALLPALPSCGRRPAPARVVRIDSRDADTLKAVSFPSLAWSGQVPGSQPAAWLSPGSFLWHGDDAPYQYQAADGDRVSIDFGKWSARLAGRVVSLNLDEDSAALWLDRASRDDLAALRFVSLNDSLPSAARPALERLAAANPHVGLSLNRHATAAQVLPLFRAHLLSLSDSAGPAAPLLARQQEVEVLYLAKGDSASLDAVGRLPHLRQLLLSQCTVRRAGQLPASLEALVLFDDTLELSRLGDLPRLRTLDLSGGGWRGASDLATLRTLRSIGFPGNASQAQFAAVVHAHPDLEAIALLGADSVTDLSPLREARHLRAVALGGRYHDLGVLRDLTSLEFVGLSEDMWKDAPDQVAAVRAALPAAVVVRVTPLCLGSGWILLLVPAALLVMLAGRRKRPA